MQTLSILCQSVRNTTSMYYLLSNNYVNEIIGYSYDFEDDELVDTFISFMKSLSLRLNTQTVQFFFIEETGAYPLLSKAILFLSFKEPMVRTAAQATILNVYRISEVRAREYALQDRITDHFLSTVMSVLNTQYASMCDACFGYRMCQPDAIQAAQLSELGPQKVYALPSSQGSPLNYERQLDAAIVGFEDWMYYLQDLMDLKIPRLTRALVVRLIEDFVQPTLMGPIDRCDCSDSAEETTTSKIEATVFPHTLTQASLSLFIICQMFRVITCAELHRAVMVTMLHPLNPVSRKRRIRIALSSVVKGSDTVSLAEKILRFGLGAVEERDFSEVRQSIQSQHPELLQKREQQIANASSRLRSSSTSSTSLSKMLNNEVSAYSGDAESFPTPISRVASEVSVGEALTSDVSGKDANPSRRGFETFFTNENIYSFTTSEVLAAEGVTIDEAAVALENKSISFEAEGVRCSLLACLVLQSLCSSLLELTERSRYDDNAAECDEEQLTASAFYIYSHLFQSMSLWPVLSRDDELFPASSLYWEEVAPLSNKLVAGDMTIEEEKEGDPIDMLEFSTDDMNESLKLVDIESENVVGIKLDLSEEIRSSVDPPLAASAPRKPSDFDVSLELAFSASESTPNPFTTEPGVSIGAGKRLSMDGAALRPGEDDEYMPPSFQQNAHSCTADDVPTLVKKFRGIDWIDPNIVPVPILDVLFEQYKDMKKWALDWEPMTIPVFLSALLATNRAAKSPPVMQVYSYLCA